MKKFISAIFVILCTMNIQSYSELCIPGIIPEDGYGKIIILTGISSCGKTSISNAVQKKFAEKNFPYALIHADDFFQLLPEKWYSFFAPEKVGPGGARFVTKVDEHGQPYVIYEEGPVIKQMGYALGGMVTSIAFSGINVVLDQGIRHQDVYNEIIFKLLEKFSVYLIYVDCPLGFAQENEEKRGGIPGLATQQKKEVIFPKHLDYTVKNGPEVLIDDLAEEIVEYVTQNSPKALGKLQADFEREK